MSEHRPPAPIPGVENTSRPSAEEALDRMSLVRAERQAYPAVRMPASQMTDMEMQSSFRMAQALSASGLFKDVASAEKAFAKLVIGRDLGLSPAQSLQLYAMEGKIEVPYPLLASFVRSRPGYDFAIRWLAGTDFHDAKVGEDVTGVALTFTVDGVERGVSVWTVADSQRAGLVRQGGNHAKYPRNMFLARAMSNGCKWYVPEVLGGLQVYAEGELDRREELGAGTGDGGAVGWGRMSVELAGQVERTIRRAEKLGHAGLANRESVQLQLHGRSEGDVREWLRESNEELDALKVDVPLVEGGRVPTRAEVEEAQGPPKWRVPADDLGQRYADAVAERPAEPEPVDADAVEDPAPLPVDTHAALVAARAAAAAAQTEEAFDAAMREVERLTALMGADQTPEA